MADDTTTPDGAATNTDDPHGIFTNPQDPADPARIWTTGDERVHDQVDAIAARIEHQILDEAATWETEFPAGPGQVVSVKDAARVIAHELAVDALFEYKRTGWQVDAYQKMVDGLVETVTALRHACEQLAFPMRVVGSDPKAHMPYAYVDTVGGLTVRWNGKQWQVMDGATRIAKERLRHLTEEGYDPQHDDRMVRGELARAALVYLDEEASAADWPWGGPDEMPKRTDRIRDLEKAGALIAAEIDRLSRARDRENNRG